MSFLSRWFQSSAKPEQRSITYGGFNGFASSGPSFTGINVNESSALGIAALWCGINTIASTIGSLPPILFEKTADGGRDRAELHPLYSLLKDNWNPESTRPVVLESLVASALLYGNCFAEIVRDGGGRPIEIWPIHPSRVLVGRDSDTGRLIYKVTIAPGGGPTGAVGSQITLDAENVLHVPGNISPDGSVGYRLLSVAQNTLGHVVGAQRFGSALWKNLARPGGVIEVAGQLSDTARENLRRSWQGLHTGADVGGVAILEEGLKYSPFTFSTNEQLQYKDLCQFYVYEIARLLNCPPSKLWSLERATWGNLETLNQDFLTTTLRPHLERLEAEFEKKLLLPGERGTYYVEFSTDVLLRADIAARNTAYAVALNNGWMCVNEIRASEGKPGIGPAGDIYRTPANMATAGTTQDEPKKPAQADAKPDDKKPAQADDKKPADPADNEEGDE